MECIVHTLEGLFKGKMERYPDDSWGFCFGEINVSTGLYIHTGKQWPLQCYANANECLDNMNKFGEALVEKYGSA